MARLAKKFYVSKGSATYAHTVYSTVAEITNGIYMRCRVDGVDGYVAAGSTTSPRATPARMLKNGVTYALWKDAINVYSYKLLTASGSFTVPAGVYQLRVTAVGGGAGGVSGCLANSRGGTSTFKTISAGGAGGAKWTVHSNRECNQDGCTTNYYTTFDSAGYGTALTVNGQCNGQPCVPLTNVSGTQIGCAGKGGFSDCGWCNGGGDQNGCGCGGSGIKVVGTVSVTPGEVIAYTVGAAGKGCCCRCEGCTHSADGCTAGYGSAGAILVEWGVGIES